MEFTTYVDHSEFDRVTIRTLETLEFGVRDAVRNAAEEGAAEAKRSGRFKDRTGQLRANIVANFLRSNGISATWEILSPTFYSRFVEEGTRPHDIWPKAGYGSQGPLRPGQTRRASGKGPHEHIVGRGLALRWVDASGPHFARMVHHPGTQPDSYMSYGYFKAERVLYAEIHVGIAKAGDLWRR